MKRIFISVGIVAVFLTVAFSTYGWRLSQVSITSDTGFDRKLSENLKKHVYNLSEVIGERSLDHYENLKKAAVYIIRQFEKAGFSVKVQTFTVNGKSVGNIIAEKKGLTNPDKVYIIGAHYDSYLNPGADTDASGIAVLLELAKMFSGRQTFSTIRLIAFVNEEPPFTRTKDMGSVRYGEKLKESGEAVEGAVILDSVGFYAQVNHSQRYPLFLGITSPNRGNFIAIVGNRKSWGLLKLARENFEQQLSFPVHIFSQFDFISSDHSSFWSNGYPAILITDTGYYRNPNHHSLSDRYQTLNYGNMAQLTNALYSFITKFVGSSVIK